MLIKRETLSSLSVVIEKLKKEKNFSISTKYKFLKIQEQIKKEYDLYFSLIQDLKEKYNGEIADNGMIKFKEEDMPRITEELYSFNNEEISLADIKFSLDELENSELSWNDLEILMPFIK